MRFKKNWKLSTRVLLLPVLFFALLTLGCGKKTVVSKVLPPPPPPAPTASIVVSPPSMQVGESAVISWHTQNANEVIIEPLGPVEPIGSKTVAPRESMTYRVTAKGPGGVQQAAARVTVGRLPSSVATSEEQLFAASGGRQDIFFDSDDFTIRPDQQSTISNDANFLKEHGDLKVTVEGRCDELGSIEYNLALGEKRANEVKNALVKAGVTYDRVSTISYGKERPFCAEPTEECLKQNRRAHLVALSR